MTSDMWTVAHVAYPWEHLARAHKCPDPRIPIVWALLSFSAAHTLEHCSLGGQDMQIILKTI